MAGALRLFVAVDVPGEHRAWVERQTADLRAQWPGARWIPVDNQHVTLRFLGATAPEAVGEVTAACEAVAAARRPRQVRLGALGAFPHARRARVLWVGLDDPDGLLGALAASLNAVLEPLGFESEERTFTPHLTLARFKTPRSLGALPELSGAPGQFTVDSFVLYRSHLSPKGARYEPLRHFPLVSAPSA